MNIHVALSLLAFFSAVVTALGSMGGLWSVTPAQPERLLVFLLSTATLMVLLLNSVLILIRSYRSTRRKSLRLIAWLCLCSLLLCIGGDVVNFNLSGKLYRHGELIRHDYLADSVFLFAPGYALLLWATLISLRLTGRFSCRQIAAALTIAALAGALSFLSMYLPGSGIYIAVTTGSYSMLITALGMGGLLLLAAHGYHRAPAGIRWVALGLVLAAAADAVIGQFWLYGNDGKGYFPLVRDVNWIIYIGSQCLVIQLPRIIVDHESRKGLLI